MSVSHRSALLVCGAVCAVLLLMTTLGPTAYQFIDTAADGPPRSVIKVISPEKLHERYVQQQRATSTGSDHNNGDGKASKSNGITSFNLNNNSAVGSNENHIPSPVTADRETESKLVDTKSVWTEAVYGLGMEDPRLVSAVKGAMLPPAPPGEPYYLEIHEKKYFSQFGQDKLVEKMFNKKRGGFFLEAGALTGERLSNTLYLERALGWTGVLVEPLPISYRVLESKNRKAYALQACLSPNTTANELSLETGFSSPYLAQISWGRKRLTPESVRVPCVPLFTVLEALGNPTVDYMSLDVEGLEMKVLRTIPWHRVKVRVIGIEINNLPEGKQAVRQYMEQQGFVFYKVVTIDYFFYHPDLSGGPDGPWVNG